MGMTKAIQERIFDRRRTSRCPSTRFVVRALRQRAGLARLGDPAVPRADRARRAGDDHDAGDDALPAEPRRGRRHGLRGAATDAQPGETYVPRVPAARDGRHRRGADRRPRRSRSSSSGSGPGEKIHEILVSEEEAPRTVRRGATTTRSSRCCPSCGRADAEGEPFGVREYSSADDVVGRRGRPLSCSSGTACCSDDSSRAAAAAMKVLTVLGRGRRSSGCRRVIPRLDELCDHVARPHRPELRPER